MRVQAKAGDITPIMLGVMGIADAFAPSITKRRGYWCNDTTLRNAAQKREVLWFP